MVRKLGWIIIFPLFLFAQNQSALDLFEEGQKLLQNRRYYEAAETFKQALKINPYYKEAYAFAGLAYYEMGNYQEARRFYERAIYYEPENIDFMLKLADIRIKTAENPKEYVAAEYYLQKAYKKEPRNLDILLAYGDYYFVLEKYDQALEFYEKARRNKENFAPYLKIALIHKKWGNYEKALDYFRQAENLASSHYRVVFEIGKFFWEQKRIEEAKKYFDLTLKFYPEFREGLMKIIDFHLYYKDYSAALFKINEMLKLDPENPILYYNMAVCYEGLKRFEEALQALLEGMQYDFGDEFLRIKAEEIAVRELPLGHSIRPRLSQPYLQKAEEAYRKNQIQEAILFYKRALRVNPLSLEARKKLASLYRERTWIDLYLKTLEAGLFVDPNNQELKDMLALNRKFYWDTLSYEKKINQYEVPHFFPIVYVNEVVMDMENRHVEIEREAKEFLLSVLANTSSLFIKEIKTQELNTISKKASLLLRLKLKEDERKVEIEAELVALATGNIFKKYFVRRYGNNRFAYASLYLAEQIAKDVLPFGRIIQIEEDMALINIGKQHHIKPKDRFLILKTKDVIDDYFSRSNFRKHYIIGEAEVVRIDERIAEVRLFKNHQVVFNLININDIVLVKKEEEKKKPQ